MATSEGGLKASHCDQKVNVNTVESIKVPSPAAQWKSEHIAWTKSVEKTESTDLGIISVVAARSEHIIQEYEEDGERTEIDDESNLQCQSLMRYSKRDVRKLLHRSPMFLCRNLSGFMISLM